MKTNQTIKLFTILLLSISLFGCGSKKVEVYSSSKDIIGINYEEVQNKLLEQGFTNIELVADNDLAISSDENNNCVSNISFDDNNAFDINSKFPIDSKITINYHSVKKIKVTNDASYYDGKDFNDVVKEFIDMGFTNVESNEDITDSYEDRDNKVYSVHINKNDEFVKDDEFDVGSEVIVNYYKYEKDECPFQYCAMQSHSYIDGSYSFSNYYMLDTVNRVAYSWSDGQGFAWKAKLSGDLENGFVMTYDDGSYEGIIFKGIYGDPVYVVESDGYYYDDFISVKPNLIYRNNKDIFE